MRVIAWREKIFAASVHLLVTLVLSLLVAVLIFFVWFPAPFDEMMGGVKLFALVVGCDLVLGPIISLVIFSSKKNRRELVFDYILIGGIQLSALIYGVLVLSESRPVFVAFVMDRLEVVTAVELEKSDLLGAAGTEFDSVSWLGPRLVAVELPADAGERTRILFSSLAGKDVQLMPKYYRPYESQIKNIKDRALPMQQLIKSKSEHRGEILAAIKELSANEGELSWLPVKHHFGFWTAIVDNKTGRPLKYIPIDPY